MVIASTEAKHATALEQLQIDCYPTLADSQRLKAPHYLHHLKIFPEGQFVALDGEKVIGMTTTMIVDAGAVKGHHTFDEFFAEGWLSPHKPGGNWLYGIDVGTHSDYRGRGVARALYVARQKTVNDLKLAGQCTVGMLSGYGAVKQTISAADYYSGLASGQIKDPTVSAQVKIGFSLDGLVEGYLDDPLCDGYGVRLILPADKPINDTPANYR